MSDTWFSIAPQMLRSGESLMFTIELHDDGELTVSAEPLLGEAPKNCSELLQRTRKTLGRAVSLRMTPAWFEANYAQWLQNYVHEIKPIRAIHDKLLDEAREESKEIKVALQERDAKKAGPSKSGKTTAGTGKARATDKDEKGEIDEDEDEDDDDKDAVDEPDATTASAGAPSDVSAATPPPPSPPPPPAVPKGGATKTANTTGELFV